MHLENYILSAEKNINAKEQNILLLDITLTKTNIRNGQIKDTIAISHSFNQNLSALVKQHQGKNNTQKARSISENSTPAVTARFKDAISTTVIYANNTKYHRPTQTMSVKKHLVNS
jgi:hypothetical protein